MDHTMQCPRCGAPRVIAKTWNEDLETANGTSRVKHTLMVCADPECQAKVDTDVAKQELKREAAILAKEQRLQRAYHHSHPKKEDTTD